MVLTCVIFGVFLSVFIRVLNKLLWVRSIFYNSCDHPVIFTTFVIVDETYQWAWCQPASKRPGCVLAGAPHVHLITANVPRTRRTPKWELRINLLGNYNANYICQLCLTKLTFAILVISWQHSNWWERNTFYHTGRSCTAAAAAGAAMPLCFK